MVEMTIDSIRVSLMNYQRVVILKEKDTDRYLPIWIGPAEADSIAVKLQDVDVPRPLTHDLLHTVVHALGAEVVHILVSDLENDTFYAKIVLQTSDGQSIAVDARPSDAIALAVRVQAPIYVNDSVVEKAGITMDKETGNAILSEERDGFVRSEGTSPIGEEELERLSAFRDFIEELNLGGLDKKES